MKAVGKRIKTQGKTPASKAAIKKPGLTDKRVRALLGEVIQENKKTFEALAKL